MIKKILIALYIFVIIIMAVATFIEKYNGTDYVSEHIYGANWFSLLWAMITAIGCICIVSKKMKRASIITLHLSFIVILVGAYVTHTSSEKGMIHLRLGKPTSTYYENRGSEGLKEKNLPFTITLDKFNISYHKGTEAVEDYESHISVDVNGEKKTKGIVSMNNTFDYSSVLFYQSSYDKDEKGSILSINSDPYGISITYLGYALLFFSLLWMLFDSKGSYQRLLRNEIFKNGMLIIVLLFVPSLLQHNMVLAENNNVELSSVDKNENNVNSNDYTFDENNHVLSTKLAEQLGQLSILYNDRICPFQTFAIDFTKKIYGSKSYKGLSAEQVVSGWLFWYKEWSVEPFIKIKGDELRESLQLPTYTALNTFFNNDMGGYIIGPYVREYYQGNQDSFHKQVADTDEKLQLIIELNRLQNIKLFPITDNEITSWYASSDSLPAATNKSQQLFIKNFFVLLKSYVYNHQYDEIEKTISKLSSYQHKYGGSSLQSPIQEKSERIYNTIPFATILFMVNLTMGFISLFFFIYQLTQSSSQKLSSKRYDIMTKGAQNISIFVLILSFLSLTICEALRWIISGNIPMANGYETMLFVAWLVMLITIVLYKRFHIILIFGYIVSGFFLLVSHINLMNPTITHIMPVLNSPLLSIHVSIIMISFALLSMTFICGLMGIIISSIRKDMYVLSQLFLYPAMTTLGMGIFIGAIWANVSWGQYWSWDPKEVWALITFMIYAGALHSNSIPSLRKPLYYHIYTTISFITILMTYFGVNFFLGGMHSYA